MTQKVMNKQEEIREMRAQKAWEARQKAKISWLGFFLFLTMLAFALAGFALMAMQQ